MRTLVDLLPSLPLTACNPPPPREKHIKWNKPLGKRHSCEDSYKLLCVRVCRPLLEELGS